MKAYEVYDGKNLIGILYADFYFRPGKAPGAWMTEFKPQYKDKSGEDVRPHISIVTNFTKPTPSRPSLLTPGEVRTLLHEFGHALHGLLSKCTFSSLSGTNVYRDFVELPSQFNENFLTQRGVSGRVCATLCNGRKHSPGIHRTDCRKFSIRCRIFLPETVEFRPDRYGMALYYI